MKVVLDANIYISALVSSLGNPRKIFERWEENEFEVLISQDIIIEIGRVLRYPRIVNRHNKDEKAIERFLKLLMTQATIIDVYERLAVIEDDESDNRYIECAVSGKADYIITGDNHLLTVSEYRGIIILPPAAFVRLLDTGLGE